MSVDVYREFAGETPDEAREKAATHFGVGSAELEVKQVKTTLIHIII